MGSEVITLSFDNVFSIETITHPEFGDLSVEILELHDENDGIGPYECHGYVGYDRGQDYHVVDDIELLNEGDLTKEQYEAASSWVKSMWQNGKIDAVVNTFEPEEEEYESEY
jgi:hypothetical protein